MLVHQSRNKHRVVADVCQQGKVCVVRQHGGGRARQHNICFLGAISLAFVRSCQKGTWSFEVFLHLACFVGQSGLWHSECYQRVNERNLQVSSAGDVVDTTHICGRFLCCLFTFATVVWVFTKRRTMCFGEFCGPNVVWRFGRGHVVVGVVRRCQQWQTLGGSVLVVFFRRAGDIDLRRGTSKEHETETVDQHNINASSLFVAFARSFGTAQIIHDRGHAPER